MRVRIFGLIGIGAVVAVIAGLLYVTEVGLASQAATGAQSEPSLRTPWGDPDLQGIWTEEFDTPFERPERFANRAIMTAEERSELDELRSGLISRDERVERGTELDVAGAYNAVFLSFKRTSDRTSLIVDPENGRIPALTPEAQAIAADDREFRLALLRSTDTCKNESVACRGGEYDPTPSPRRSEPAPRYNTGRMNRHDNPEDGSGGDRCLSGRILEFGTAFGGSFRRIVQTAGGVSMYYDVGQGQGFQRNIVMNGSPHLPDTIRQWWGDSRGHWEGDTLVIDVTNFSPKHNYRGSRENLHMVERWTRTGPETLEYEVLIDDPSVWVQPWTVKQEFGKQSDQQNRIYYEPRCYEGNYGFPALLRSARLAEQMYAEGKGPHPATNDNATDFVGVEVNPFR
jgi:hypothetical protein